MSLKQFSRMKLSRLASGVPSLQSGQEILVDLEPRFRWSVSRPTWPTFTTLCELNLVAINKNMLFIYYFNNIS